MGGTSRLKMIAVAIVLALGLAVAAAAPTIADATGVDRANDITSFEPGADVTQAIQPRANCRKPTTRNGYAYGKCYLNRGETVRLRADCKYAIDRYSNWKTGGGWREFRTINKCSRGIRGGIWEIS